MLRNATGKSGWWTITELQPQCQEDSGGALGDGRWSHYSASISVALPEYQTSDVRAYDFSERNVKIWHFLPFNDWEHIIIFNHSISQHFVTHLRKWVSVVSATDPKKSYIRKKEGWRLTSSGIEGREVFLRMRFCISAVAGPQIHVAGAGGFGAAWMPVQFGHWAHWLLEM